MVKKVKCAQCKYLKIPSSETEKEHLLNLLSNESARKDWDVADWWQPDEKIILFGCEANKIYVLNDFEIDQEKDCKFFRNNTLTAWQEVRQDIWRRIKGLNPISIIKYILNK